MEYTEDKKKMIIDDKFPLSSKYDPGWQLENEMGSPCLWLIEGLTRKMELKPGMRILDLGCGKAMTSIFLAKEYGVQVYANDLWISPTDNWKRICDAGVENLVCPISSEAHSLPFAEEFFDAIISVNSYQFFGTADTYFNQYLGKVLKRGGQVGFALPGIYKEFDDLVPEYLKEYWWSDFYYFHSFDWWKRYFTRCGTVDIECLDDYDGEGSRIMIKWEAIPDRMQLVRTDNGRNLSWIRLIIRKK